MLLRREGSFSKKILTTRLHYANKVETPRKVYLTHHTTMLSSVVPYVIYVYIYYTTNTYIHIYILLYYTTILLYCYTTPLYYYTILHHYVYLSISLSLYIYIYILIYYTTMLSSVVPWSCGRDDMLQVDPSGPRRPFYLLIKLGTIDKK